MNNFKKISKVFLLVVILICTLGTSASALNFSNWSTKANMLEENCTFGSVSFNGKIYTFGGSTIASPYGTNTVEEYDIATNTWTFKENMSIDRCFPNVAEVDGIIYVMGGRNSSYVGVVNSNEAYDPSTDTWTTKAALPEGIQAGGVAVVDKKIYLIGGYTSNGVTNSVYVYDPATNKWTTETTMPTARGCVAIVALDNKIYVFGGQVTSASAVTTSFNIVQVYDTLSRKWSSLNPMSTSLTSARAFSYDGKIYIFGGGVASNSSYTEQSSIIEYEPVNDTMNVVGELPSPNTAFGLSLVDNCVYVYGGSIPDTASNTSSPSNSLTVCTVASIMNAPSLTATAGDAQVTNSWTSITEAANYKLYRAITSGGPYTQIATGVAGTTYTDSTATNGTTYYYVVIAVDPSGNESVYSNEASATPKTVGKALLNITMTNGVNKEYEMTADQVSNFVSWYDNKGANSPSYTVSEIYNLGKLTSRTDNIAFSKIAFFEVMAYSDTGTSSTSTPTPNTATALLKVTMSTGDVFEFEMTTDQRYAFTAWYSSGAASRPSFVIDKNYNLGPFTSRKDYLAYDQISSFEVMEY